MDEQTWNKFAATEWDGNASSWNEKSKKMWEGGSRKNILPFFKKYVKPAGPVLDVGCGSGYSTNKLAEAGYNVAGVDISNNMIHLAKSQFPHILFHRGNINKLAFQNETFSGILAINVLEWTEIPQHALNELFRILHHGGILCIGILGPTAGPRANSFGRLRGKQVMMNTMMPWEFQKMASETGFVLVDEFGVPKDWHASSHCNLPLQARQALSFMWVFCMKKGNGRGYK